MQHLLLLTRLEVHHAGVVHAVRRAAWQQGVIGDGEHGGVHDQGLNRGRLRDESAEPLGEASHEVFVASVGGVQVRPEVRRHRRHCVVFDGVAQHRIPVAGDSG
jgi:hypothetical protein